MHICTFKGLHSTIQIDPNESTVGMLRDYIYAHLSIHEDDVAELIVSGQVIRQEDDAKYLADLALNSPASVIVSRNRTRKNDTSSSKDISSDELFFSRILTKYLVRSGEIYSSISKAFPGYTPTSVSLALQNPSRESGFNAQTLTQEEGASTGTEVILEQGISSAQSNSLLVTSMANSVGISNNGNNNNNNTTIPPPKNQSLTSIPFEALEKANRKLNERLEPKDFALALEDGIQRYRQQTIRAQKRQKEKENEVMRGKLYFSHELSSVTHSFPPSLGLIGRLSNNSNHSTASEFGDSPLPPYSASSSLYDIANFNLLEKSNTKRKENVLLFFATLFSSGVFEKYTAFQLCEILAASLSFDGGLSVDGFLEKMIQGVFPLWDESQNLAKKMKTRATLRADMHANSSYVSPSISSYLSTPLSTTPTPTRTAVGSQESGEETKSGKYHDMSNLFRHSYYQNLLTRGSVTDCGYNPLYLYNMFNRTSFVRSSIQLLMESEINDRIFAKSFNSSDGNQKTYYRLAQVSSLLHPWIPTTLVQHYSKSSANLDSRPFPGLSLSHFLPEYLLGQPLSKDYTTPEDAFAYPADADVTHFAMFPTPFNAPDPSTFMRDTTANSDEMKNRGKHGLQRLHHPWCGSSRLKSASIKRQFSRKDKGKDREYKDVEKHICVGNTTETLPSFKRPNSSCSCSLRRKTDRSTLSQSQQLPQVYSDRIFTSRQREQDTRERENEQEVHFQVSTMSLSDSMSSVSSTSSFSEYICKYCSPSVHQHQQTCSNRSRTTNTSPLDVDGRNDRTKVIVGECASSFAAYAKRPRYNNLSAGDGVVTGEDIEDWIQHPMSSSSSLLPQHSSILDTGVGVNPTSTIPMIPIDSVEKLSIQRRSKVFDRSRDSTVVTPFESSEMLFAHSVDDMCLYLYSVNGLTPTSEDDTIISTNMSTFPSAMDNNSSVSSNGDASSCTRSSLFTSSLLPHSASFGQNEEREDKILDSAVLCPSCHQRTCCVSTRLSSDLFSTPPIQSVRKDDMLFSPEELHDENDLRQHEENDECEICNEYVQSVSQYIPPSSTNLSQETFYLSLQQAFALSLSSPSTEGGLGSTSMDTYTNPTFDTSSIPLKYHLPNLSLANTKDPRTSFDPSVLGMVLPYLSILPSRHLRDFNIYSGKHMTTEPISSMTSSMMSDNDVNEKLNSLRLPLPVTRGEGLFLARGHIETQLQFMLAMEELQILFHLVLLRLPTVDRGILPQWSKVSRVLTDAFYEKLPLIAGMLRLYAPRDEQSADMFLSHRGAFLLPPLPIELLQRVECGKKSEESTEEDGDDNDGNTDEKEQQEAKKKAKQVHEQGNTLPIDSAVLVNSVDIGRESISLSDLHSLMLKIHTKLDSVVQQSRVCFTSHGFHSDTILAVPHTTAVLTPGTNRSRHGYGQSHGHSTFPFPPSDNTMSIGTGTGDGIEGFTSSPASSSSSSSISSPSYSSPHSVATISTLRTMSTDIDINGEREDSFESDITNGNNNSNFNTSSLSSGPLLRTSIPLPLELHLPTVLPSLLVMLLDVHMRLLQDPDHSTMIGPEMDCFCRENSFSLAITGQPPSTGSLLSPFFLSIVPRFTVAQLYSLIALLNVGASQVLTSGDGVSSSSSSTSTSSFPATTSRLNHILVMEQISGWLRAQPQYAFLFALDTLNRKNNRVFRNREGFLGRVAVVRVALSEAVEASEKHSIDFFTSSMGQKRRAQALVAARKALDEGYDWVAPPSILFHVRDHDGLQSFWGKKTFWELLRDLQRAQGPANKAERELHVALRRWHYRPASALDIALERQTSVVLQEASVFPLALSSPRSKMNTKPNVGSIPTSTCEFTDMEGDAIEAISEDGDEDVTRNVDADEEVIVGSDTTTPSVSTYGIETNESDSTLTGRVKLNDSLSLSLSSTTSADADVDTSIDISSDTTVDADVDVEYGKVQKLGMKDQEVSSWISLFKKSHVALFTNTAASWLENTHQSFMDLEAHLNNVRFGVNGDEKKEEMHNHRPFSYPFHTTPTLSKDKNTHNLAPKTTLQSLSLMTNPSPFTTFAGTTTIEGSIGSTVSISIPQSELNVTSSSSASSPYTSARSVTKSTWLVMLYLALYHPSSLFALPVNLSNRGKNVNSSVASIVSHLASSSGRGSASATITGDSDVAIGTSKISSDISNSIGNESGSGKTPRPPSTSRPLGASIARNMELNATEIEEHVTTTEMKDMEIDSVSTQLQTQFSTDTTSTSATMTSSSTRSILSKKNKSGERLYQKHALEDGLFLLNFLHLQRCLPPNHILYQDSDKKRVSTPGQSSLQLPEQDPFVFSLWAYVGYLINADVSIQRQQSLPSSSSSSSSPLTYTELTFSSHNLYINSSSFHAAVVRMIAPQTDFKAIACPSTRVLALENVTLEYLHAARTIANALKPLRSLEAEALMVAATLPNLDLDYAIDLEQRLNKSFGAPALLNAMKIYQTQIRGHVHSLPPNQRPGTDVQISQIIWAVDELSPAELLNVLVSRDDAGVVEENMSNINNANTTTQQQQLENEEEIQGQEHPQVQDMSRNNNDGTSSSPSVVPHLTSRRRLNTSFPSSIPHSHASHVSSLGLSNTAVLPNTLSNINTTGNDSIPAVDSHDAMMEQHRRRIGDFREIAKIPSVTIRHHAVAHQLAQRFLDLPGFVRSTYTNHFPDTMGTAEPFAIGETWGISSTTNGGNDSFSSSSQNQNLSHQATNQSQSASSQRNGEEIHYPFVGMRLPCVSVALLDETLERLEPRSLHDDQTLKALAVSSTRAVDGITGWYSAAHDTISKPLFGIYFSPSFSPTLNKSALTAGAKTGVMYRTCSSKAWLLARSAAVKKLLWSHLQMEYYSDDLNDHDDLHPGRTFRYSAQNLTRIPPQLFLNDSEDTSFPSSISSKREDEIKTPTDLSLPCDIWSIPAFEKIYSLVQSIEYTTEMQSITTDMTIHMTLRHLSAPKQPYISSFSDVNRETFRFFNFYKYDEKETKIDPVFISSTVSSLISSRPSSIPFTSDFEPYMFHFHREFGHLAPIGPFEDFQILTQQKDNQQKDSPPSSPIQHQDLCSLSRTSSTHPVVPANKLLERIRSLRVSLADGTFVKLSGTLSLSTALISYIFAQISKSPEYKNTSQQHVSLFTSKEFPVISAYFSPLYTTKMYMGENSTTLKSYQEISYSNLSKVDAQMKHFLSLQNVEQFNPVAFEAQRELSQAIALTHHIPDYGPMLLKWRDELASVHQHQLAFRNCLSSMINLYGTTIYDEIETTLKATISEKYCSASIVEHILMQNEAMVMAQMTRPETGQIVIRAAKFTLCVRTLIRRRLLQQYFRLLDEYLQLKAAQDNFDRRHAEFINQSGGNVDTGYLNTISNAQNICTNLITANQSLISSISQQMEALDIRTNSLSLDTTSATAQILSFFNSCNEDLVIFLRTMEETANMILPQNHHLKQKFHQFINQSTPYRTFTPSQEQNTTQMQD